MMIPISEILPTFSKNSPKEPEQNDSKISSIISLVPMGYLSQMTMMKMVKPIHSRLICSLQRNLIIYHHCIHTFSNSYHMIIDPKYSIHDILRMCEFLWNRCEVTKMGRISSLSAMPSISSNSSINTILPEISIFLISSAMNKKM